VRALKYMASDTTTLYTYPGNAKYRMNKMMSISKSLIGNDLIYLPSYQSMVSFNIYVYSISIGTLVCYRPFL
jgi:hypothetical protein